MYIVRFDNKNINFISPFNTQTMHIKSFYTQQHWCVSLKTSYPGGIRTQVFSFLRRMRCPLRHAAIGQLQAIFTSQTIYVNTDLGSRLNPFSRYPKCHQPSLIDSWKRVDDILATTKWSPLSSETPPRGIPHSAFELLISAQIIFVFMDLFVFLLTLWLIRRNLRARRRMYLCMQDDQLLLQKIVVNNLVCQLGLFTYFELALLCIQGKSSFC
jgi:hypothetical protein